MTTIHLRRIHVVPSCSGGCQQGRTACPAPEACELPIDQTPLGWRVCDWTVAVVFVGFLGALFLGLLQ